MTERFTEWLFILAQRDWALTNFVGIAFWAMLGWEGIRLWPDPARRWFRLVYLLAGGVVFYALIVLA